MTAADEHTPEHRGSPDRRGSRRFRRTGALQACGRDGRPRLGAVSAGQYLLTHRQHRTRTASRRQLSSLDVASAGMVFALAWWWLLQSYRTLNRAKFGVINTIGSNLPLRLFSQKWRHLESYIKATRTWPPRALWAWPSGYHELGTVERTVAFAFGAIYIAELMRQATGELPRRARSGTSPAHRGGTRSRRRYRKPISHVCRASARERRARRARGCPRRVPAAPRRSTATPTGRTQSVSTPSYGPHSRSAKAPARAESSLLV